MCIMGRCVCPTLLAIERPLPAALVNGDMGADIPFTSAMK